LRSFGTFLTSSQMDTRYSILDLAAGASVRKLTQQARRARRYGEAPGLGIRTRGLSCWPVKSLAPDWAYMQLADREDHVGLPVLPRLRRLANGEVVDEDEPHCARQLMPTPTGPNTFVLAGRATRVPHRTGNPGIERTTTVTRAPYRSRWSLTSTVPPR
jgi:hypothetical protein